MAPVYSTLAPPSHATDFGSIYCGKCRSPAQPHLKFACPNHPANQPRLFPVYCRPPRVTATGWFWPRLPARIEGGPNGRSCWHQFNAIIDLLQGRINSVAIYRRYEAAVRPFILALRSAGQPFMDLKYNYFRVFDYDFYLQLRAELDPSGIKFFASLFDHPAYENDRLAAIRKLMRDTPDIDQFDFITWVSNLTPPTVETFTSPFYSAEDDKDSDSVLEDTIEDTRETLLYPEGLPPLGDYEESLGSSIDMPIYVHSASPSPSPPPAYALDSNRLVPPNNDTSLEAIVDTLQGYINRATNNVDIYADMPPLIPITPSTDSLLSTASIPVYYTQAIDPDPNVPLNITLSEFPTNFDTPHNAIVCYDEDTMQLQIQFTSPLDM